MKVCLLHDVTTVVTCYRARQQGARQCDGPGMSVCPYVCHKMFNVKQLLTGKRQMKNSKTDLYQIGVNGDFHLRSNTPLAAEIVFPPLSAIRKALITSKRYKIDGKCQQNTKRKP
jgi:hypothetical protein